MIGVDALETIRYELAQAAARGQRVRRVWVTSSAVRGSIVTMPVPPWERTCVHGVHGLPAHRDCGQCRRWLRAIDRRDGDVEVVMHPRDWADVRACHPHAGDDEPVALSRMGGATVYGVEVEHE